VPERKEAGIIGSNQEESMRRKGKRHRRKKGQAIERKRKGGQCSAYHVERKSAQKRMREERE
jgi:hypothetical protein